ncbi:ARM repeat-containing protein [Phlebopus sp. FC_14]|nr:ARM repeat-containing protein [Phlebopus sp. FC_14]
MTVRQITTISLKQLKNSVIGNPSAKLALARDTAFIHSLVSCLNHPPNTGEPQGSHDDIRIEAAHVIASLSYGKYRYISLFFLGSQRFPGSETALGSLLRANALQEIVRALASPQTLASIPLKSALARGLRVLGSAVAEVVGPSQGVLRTYSPDLRTEAKVALNYLLEFECLDVYLPLLADASAQTAMSIAQLIGGAVRTDSHRSAVVEWLPRLERQREVKGRRGWERPDMAHVVTMGKPGGWVIRSLISMIQRKDLKVQEAALCAIGALAEDNPFLASALAKVPADAVPTLMTVLSLTKSRTIDVQLAASLGATHIIRAHASNHASSLDHAAALTIIHVLNRILLSSVEQPQHRIKACYTLYYLVRDEKELCLEAFDRGVLANLASLVKSITPLEKLPEWDVDEPESTVMLREAALTAIASISLFDRVIKREVADNLQLTPVLQACLSQKSIGVRCAACHCFRALSRDAALVRTNITDGGAGMAVFEIFKKEDEDIRVTFAALVTVSNLVIDFSPLRTSLLENGLLPRLMQLFAKEEHDMRTNVLWVIKNLLCKSTLPTKTMVMTLFGWSQLAEFVSLLLNDPNPNIQEQAFSILRNLAEDEVGITLVFESIGEETLASCISAGLDSSNEYVTRETAYVLGNITNGSRSQQDLIFTHPHVLDAIHACMAEAKSGIRYPLVSCVHNLLLSNPRRRHDLAEAGFVSTLRHMCEWTGGMSVSISPGGARHHHQINPEDDKDSAVLARRVLDLMDPSTIGDML